jgi:WXG100 family type VII secretion target
MTDMSVTTAQPLSDGRDYVRQTMPLASPATDHVSDLRDGVSGRASVPAGAFKATPQDISDASSACYNTAGQIWQELGTLYNYIQGMEQWWQGIASTTFQELMVEYNTYSQMLYNALLDISTGLNGNFVNYSDTENANIQTVTSIQDQLSAVNFS